MPNTVKVLNLTMDEKSSLEDILRCPTTEATIYDKYIKVKCIVQL